MTCLKFKQIVEITPWFLFLEDKKEFNEISNHKTINLKPMFLIYSVLYVQRSEYIRQHRRLNKYSFLLPCIFIFYLTVILNKKNANTNGIFNKNLINRCSFNKSI